jgi:hypothetical protein
MAHCRSSVAMTKAALNVFLSVIKKKTVPVAWTKTFAGDDKAIKVFCCDRRMHCLK